MVHTYGPRPRKHVGPRDGAGVEGSPRNSENNVTLEPCQGALQRHLQARILVRLLASSDVAMTRGNVNISSQCGQSVLVQK